MNDQCGHGMKWLIPMKNCKKELKNMTQHKYHIWMLLNISGWILVIRGWWVTVKKCARRKRISIKYASNLPNLPWNITSKVHKIRTTLKRRSHLQACIGKPLPPRCGKSRPLRRQQRRQRQQQQQSFIDTSENEVHWYKERNPSRGQNLDFNIWMTDVQKALCWHCHLQERVVQHHDEH